MKHFYEKLAFVLQANMKTKLILLALYLTAVLFYGLIALQFDSTRSGLADEAIYINMARSFHYDLNFMRHAEPMGYDCILYSMLLSVCYFFYLPENILPLMRFLGVILMCSTVFPSFLLANKILNERRYALFISFISIIIPSMTLSYYMYQEVLLYPLTLWFLYFFYNVMSSNKYRYQFMIGLFIYVLYNTKTVAMYILLAYLLFLVLDCLFFHKNYKRCFISLLSVCAAFFSIYFIVKLGINFLNDFQIKQSHYDNQISTSIQLFINNLTFYIPQVVRGVFFYLYYTLLSVFAFPILIPLASYNRLNLKDKRFLLFCALSIISAILLIVGGIFLIEDAKLTAPRFHSRYFFAFFIPFIILTLKAQCQACKLSSGMILILIGLFSFPFFAEDGLLFFGSFVDNYLFSIFRSINLFLGKYAQPLLAFLFISYGLMVFLFLYLAQKSRLNSKLLCMVLILFFGLLNLTNNGIILKYKETSLMEQQVAHDCLKIAQYLADKEGLSAFVGKNNIYFRAINYNTQLNKDYFYLGTEKIINSTSPINNNVSYIIIPIDLPITPKNCTAIDADLYTVTLYKLNALGKLVIDEKK